VFIDFFRRAPTKIALALVDLSVPGARIHGILAKRTAPASYCWQCNGNLGFALFNQAFTLTKQRAGVIVRGSLFFAD
jgi:hypothetical protein